MTTLELRRSFYHGEQQFTTSIPAHRVLEIVDLTPWLFVTWFPDSLPEHILLGQDDTVSQMAEWLSENPHCAVFVEKGGNLSAEVLVAEPYADIKARFESLKAKE